MSPAKRIYEPRIFEGRVMLPEEQVPPLPLRNGNADLDSNAVFGLPIFRGSFGLRRSHSELRGNSRMAPTSLDSKAILAQEPKRSALHHCRRRATRERRGWNRARVANRGSAGICVGTSQQRMERWLFNPAAVGCAHDP